MKSEKDKPHKYDSRNDEGMSLAELHARDLRNTATPVHQPVVQHCDYVAAEAEGRLDEALAAEGAAIEGDADHAVAAAESVEEQEAALEPDEDEPVVDNTPPEGDDGESPLNAFGNVAPEGTMEDDAEAQGEHNPLTAQGIGEITNADPFAGPDEPEDADTDDYGNAKRAKGEPFKTRMPYVNNSDDLYREDADKTGDTQDEK